MREDGERGRKKCRGEVKYGDPNEMEKNNGGGEWYRR
jgi:hypothetical protein